MEKEELLAALRLQATEYVGDVTAKKLIANTGSAAQVFKDKAKTLQKINGIGTRITHALFNTKNIDLANAEFSYIKKNNINYHYFLNKEYPQHLQHCIDAPILFFSDGNINLQNQKIISIVGTRKMSAYGNAFCQELLADLAPYNPIIVSGFAYGVDICAHKAAIKNKLQTIAALAHGLDIIYPKTHKKYMGLMHKNGGFITEFWHNTPPIRENFLKRNRIIAGLSKATIIIESAKKGGSLVTADIANSYNRDVFALMGRSTDVYSEGCNNLIKSHQAHALTTATDIVKMLNWEQESKNTPIQQKKLFLDLDKNEQKIYDYLVKNGKQALDVIALKCAIPTYQTSSILLQMELKGAVKPLPGKTFEV